MSTATIWLSTAAIALALSAVGPTLDTQDDHSAEWPTSAELQALQASEAGTQRREAAAQALCAASQGPQSEARWTPEGGLVCTTGRKGKTTNVITTFEAKL